MGADQALQPSPKIGKRPMAWSLAAPMLGKASDSQNRKEFGNIMEATSSIVSSPNYPSCSGGWGSLWVLFKLLSASQLFGLMGGCPRIAPESWRK